MSNIVPFEQQITLARAFAKSGLFGVKTEDQALALMALCEAEGMHPARAIQEFHIVQGRPAMKADAMLARFQKAGGKVEWHAYTDTKVDGTFSHAQGGSVRVEWTIDQAKKIGLAGKDNWKHYPRAMLRARCISEGVRTVFPGATQNTYSVEEVEDMPAKHLGTAEEVVAGCPPELLSLARAAADGGRDTFAAFWKNSLNGEKRNLLAPELADLKARTEKAEKEKASTVIDNDTGEIHEPTFGDVIDQP